MSSKFEIGDHVRVGDGKIHWMVVNEYMLGPHQYLVLKSPMSGRRHGSFANYVTLIKKAVFDHHGRPVV